MVVFSISGLYFSKILVYFKHKVIKKALMLKKDKYGTYRVNSRKYC
jgi:hypothetical protein